MNSKQRRQYVRKQMPSLRVQFTTAVMTQSISPIGLDHARFVLRLKNPTIGELHYVKSRIERQ